MEGIGGDYWADERGAHMWARPLYDQIGSRFSGEPCKRSDRLYFSDNDFDFPPTAHPGCELCTFCLFVLGIITFAVWGGWNLISSL